MAWGCVTLPKLVSAGSQLYALLWNRRCLPVNYRPLNLRGVELSLRDVADYKVHHTPPFKIVDDHRG